MGRNSRSSNRIAERNVQKSKKRKNLEKSEGNLTGLRRSGRITSNTFATNRITNRRITLPTGFFSGGIKSAVAKKSGVKDVYKEHSKLILNEDLHALLQNFDEESAKDITLSRSDSTVFRGNLPKKTNRNSSENNYNTVSSYYLRVSNKNHEENERKSSGESNFDLTYNNEEFFEEDNLASTSGAHLDEKFAHSADHHLHNPNFCFAASLRAQLNFNYNSHKNQFILSVKLSARHLNDILDGAIEIEVEHTEDDMLSKRIPCKEVQNIQDCDIPLVPQSQWVYSTPNKQNVKKFVFDDPNSDKIVPAVLETGQKRTTLYDIKPDIVNKVNLVKFSEANVPIDERYLSRVCQTTVEEGNAKKRQKLSVEAKENVFQFSESDFRFESTSNVFASNPEDSIDIRGLIELPMEEDFEEDPYERAPADYRQQLLMATQRPAKTMRKTSKRHLLKAKSLSFENTPPKGAPVSVFEPKRLTENFERDFLELPENVEFSVPSQQAFFPRRNFDKE